MIPFVMPSNKTYTCRINIILKTGHGYDFKTNKEPILLENMKQSILSAVQYGTTYLDNDGLLINGDAIAIVNFIDIRRDNNG